MASFDAFFPRLLAFEGGFVDDPLDPGGATNKGITLGVFERHARPLLGLGPTLENLKQLSNREAAILYKALYWDALKGDAIALQPLAEILVDFQVNAGAHATILLQRVLNDLSEAKLAIDGRMGDATLAALERSDLCEVYRRYREGRMDYYRELALQHPLLRKFLNGWLMRVKSFPADVAPPAAPAALTGFAPR